MKRLRAGLLLWLALFASAALVMAADLPGSISGVARDANNKPLAGMRLTLTRGGGLPLTYQTTSNDSGEFAFVGIRPGEYTVSGVLNGHAMSAPLIIRVASGSVHVTANVKLIEDPALARPAADASLPRSAPTLEFQASGLHGLIDPGGYSASTSGAASGLVQGIADLRRAETHFGLPPPAAWPCDLEPSLREAVAEHPYQIEPNYHLGQFYAAHDEPAKAIPYLKRAMEMGDGDVVFAQALANAFIQGGDFERARTLLSPLAEHSTNPEIHRTLARAEEGSGKFLQAAQEYRQAEKEAPSVETLFGVGYELILAGFVADSATVFEDGLKKYPISISIHIGAGVTQLLLGRTSTGLRNLLDATDIDPADPRPYPILASVSAAPGDEAERVRSSLRRRWRREPENGEAGYDYALALSREPNTEVDEIEAILKRSIQLDPGRANAHLLLGNLFARQFNYEAAVREYEIGVHLDPDLGEAHYRLALAYKRAGRTGESARESERYGRYKDHQNAGVHQADISQFISVMDSPNLRQRSANSCPVPALK